MARPGFLRHKKFARLARTIGSKPLALGSIEMVWEVAYENGDPDVGDASDVEFAAEWRGEPGALVAALVDSGLLDRVTDDDGAVRYAVHDLFDHAPDYVWDRRDKEEERRKVKSCADCGKEFRSTDMRAKYCSNACRQAAHRKRETDRNGRETEAPSRETDRNGPPAPAPAPAPAPKKTDRSPPEVPAEAPSGGLTRPAPANGAAPPPAGTPRSPRPAPVHLQGVHPDLAAVLELLDFGVVVGRKATDWQEADELGQELERDAAVETANEAAPRSRGYPDRVPLTFLVAVWREAAADPDREPPRPRRAPGELPKLGDPDFNDPRAWGADPGAFFRRTDGRTGKAALGYEPPKYQPPRMLTAEEAEKLHGAPARAAGTGKQTP